MYNVSWEMSWEMMSVHYNYNYFFSKVTYGFVLDLFCFLYFFCDSIFRADSVTGIVMQGYCVNSPLKTKCIDFCPL